MAFFQKEETVFERKDILLGELNYDSPTGTCYDNVLTFSFPVRKNRLLRLEVKSDKVIDAVIARPDASAACQALGITEKVLGPVETKDNTEMGVLIGLTPGDRAVVSLRAWIDSK